MREHLLSKIRMAPFFVLIGDTTIDMWKIDQYSNCIRYVHFQNSAESVEGEKPFLVSMHFKTSLLKRLCCLLEDASIDINKCQG